MGASASHRITLLAGERNYLLYTGIIIAALRVLPLGVSATAVLAYQAVCLTQGAGPAAPPPWWAVLLDSVGTTTQLAVAAASCAAAFLVHAVAQARGH